MPNPRQHELVWAVSLSLYLWSVCVILMVSKLPPQDWKREVTPVYRRGLCLFLGAALSKNHPQMSKSKIKWNDYFSPPYFHLWSLFQIAPFHFGFFAVAFFRAAMATCCVFLNCLLPVTPLRGRTSSSSSSSLSSSALSSSSSYPALPACKNSQKYQAWGISPGLGFDFQRSYESPHQSNRLDGTSS